MPTFRFRRGNSSSAATNNVVLQPGEPGYELDTRVFKIGDGVTPWNDLLPPLGTGVGGGDILTNTMVGVEHTGSAWPSRPPGGTSIRVHWIGGIPANPPPGISGHDLWSVPAQF
jgi:hypothetical protein